MAWAAAEFSPGTHQADDLTLLMLNYVGATEPARV